MGNKSLYSLSFKKVLTGACLIVNTYLVKENEL